MKATRLLAAVVFCFAVSNCLLAQTDFADRSKTRSPVPTRIWRSRDFGIPFELAADSRDASQVHLYVSADGGRDWKLYQRQTPNAKGFQFQAPSDGEFWFAVRTVDRRGQLVAHTGFEPELKVIVDTLEPGLELQVNVDSTGQVLAQWQANDANLWAHSFRLHYQTDDGTWQQVQVATPEENDTRTRWDGHAEWWVRSRSGDVVVRAEIFDRAQNPALVRKRLALSSVARARTPGNRLPVSEASHGLRDHHDGEGFNRIDGVADLAKRDGADRQGQTPGAVEAGSDKASSSRFPVQLPSWLSGVQHPTDTFGAAGGKPSRPQPESETRSWNSAPFGPPSQREVSGPVANRNAQGFGNGTIEQEIRPRISASPNFELDYDLFDVGPQGARRVELWFTRDRGLTWELFGADPDKVSPFEVQLKQEGLYGFRLTVHGFDAEPPRPPRQGDPADIWVGVDWTKPVGEITRAQYLHEGQDGVVLIEWTAEDALLAQEPITLSYAESPDGPWTVFASNLRNSGSYRWQVSRQLPRRLYLQMEVRDQVGNVTTSVYDPDAFARDGSPKGKIRDVRPLRRTALRSEYRH